VRDTWYADHRDLVKWGTLAHIAERQSLAAIVQVAYLRRGTQGALQNGSAEVPIAPAVWSFFRDVTAVRSLGEILSRRIVVIDKPFTPQRRREYRLAVVESVRSIESSKIVLLDPDTGIAPSKPSGKHVTAEDIAAVWEALQPGDWIAVYQHRSRNKTWKQGAQDRFTDVCGNGVQVYQATKIAPDVILLAKRKP